MIGERKCSEDHAYHVGDITYCSNVHAGEGLGDIKRNIDTFIKPVRIRRDIKTMASGLWISADAAEALQDTQALQGFKKALMDAQLTLPTINGFPYGGFHQEQVKSAVYIPDWSDSARLIYTQNLSEILAACLPEECVSGVISTVPLGYKQGWSEAKQRQAIDNLNSLSIYLYELECRTQKRIVLSLEMEPDCVLENTDELIDFFEQCVDSEISYKQYLGCCYDVCHQAVMYEDLYDSLQRIVDAKINIAKIQLSSSLELQFDPEKDDKAKFIDLIKPFCEEKYLHQVKSLDMDGNISSASDLCVALDTFQARKQSDLQGFTWRIHFHVPIHFQKLRDQELKTSRNDLLTVFDFLRENPKIRPLLEVETYSWQVLPENLRPHNDNDLIDGIVDELSWVEQQLNARNLVSLK